MPWHLSAKKRLRRNSKKHAANKSCLSALRTLVKKSKQFLQDAESLKAAQKALDKAALRGIIHPNAAARRTSRLMKQAYKLRASP